MQVNPAIRSPYAVSVPARAPGPTVERGEDRVVLGGEHRDWRGPGRAAVVGLCLAVGLLHGDTPSNAATPVGHCWVEGEVAPGACAERFDRLGEQGQTLYRSMGPGLKSWFAQNVNGRAGPLGVVNKRDAFVKGTWAGFDVFDFVNGRLDKKLREQSGASDVKGDRALSADEIARGRTINETCRHLTASQRQAFVEMLDLDTGRK